MHGSKRYNNPEQLTETVNVQIGPIKCFREMNTPTSKSLDCFYNIIKTKQWFDSYDYVIVGSFSNILKNNQQWTTWDIDMVVTGPDDSNLKEIKEVLLELTRVAIIECGFYLDLYYVSSDVEFNESRFSKYPYNSAISMKHDYENRVNMFMLVNDWKDGIIKELMTGTPTEIIVDRFAEMYVIPKTLSISTGVYKDGKNCNRWLKGKEVYDGLWERYINFPSVKQIERMIHGYIYEKPIEVKRYYKNR